jgi:glycosyltransferase involved in cell wall biosynthesis
VAFISNASTIGGGERCLEDLIRGLGPAITPLVLCPGEGPFPDLLRQQGVAVETRRLENPEWKRPARWLADTLWLRRRLTQHGAALVHANSPLSARLAAVAVRSLSLPLVCHVHYPATEPFIRWAFHGLPAPQAFIMVCDDLQREMGDLLRRFYPAAQQHVVYNGIDVGAFGLAPWPAGPERHIGIVANLQPVKGHEDFLRMAARIHSRHPEARFHIVGGDVQQLGRQAVIDALVTELGLGDVVRFWGFVDDVRAAYRAFEILVCPSYEEASPRCLMEAMAMGRPIVATRVNGIPDVIEDGANGLLVRPGQVDELTAAVERILTEPALGRALADEGRRRAVTRYSEAAYTRGVAGVFAGCGLENVR